MPMTPLTGLDRTSPTFKTDLDTFFLSSLPQFVTEANALETAVDADKTAAAGSAVDAAGSALAADASADAAAASADAAAISEANALSSAASALNAPGTSATSTTNLTVGAGEKTLMIQPGKLFVPGQALVIASAADPAGVQMVGVITAHNSTTGVLTLTVSSGAFSGAGTHADWVVSPTVLPVATPQLVAAAGAVAVPFAIDAAIVFSIAMS